MTGRMGARLTDATVMCKAQGSLEFGLDPVLGCGNLGLKRRLRGEKRKWENRLEGNPRAVQLKRQRRKPGGEIKISYC